MYEKFFKKKKKTKKKKKKKKIANSTCQSFWPHNHFPRQKALRSARFLTLCSL